MPILRRCNRGQVRACTHGLVNPNDPKRFQRQTALENRIFPIETRGSAVFGTQGPEVRILLLRPRHRAAPGEAGRQGCGPPYVLTCKASKAGLSLRCPFQWPKRAIGTFGQLRPDLPGASRPWTRHNLSKAGPGGLPLAEFEAEPQPCLTGHSKGRLVPASAKGRPLKLAEPGLAGLSPPYFSGCASSAPIRSIAAAFTCANTWSSPGN